MSDNATPPAEALNIVLSITNIASIIVMDTKGNVLWKYP